MTNKKIIYSLFLFLLLIPFSGFSQFTYFDVGLSHSNLVIAGKRDMTFRPKSQLKTTQFHLGGLWRFNRFFGVGLDLGVPVIQKSKYTLRNSNAISPYGSGNNEFFDSYTESRYKPQNIDYTFKQSIQVGFIGRVFVGGASNVFVDIRVSALKMKENFIFERRAVEAYSTGYSSDYLPPLKELSINEDHEQLLIVPGFAVGWQPHLGERFFMNFNLAYDFYIMKAGSFSHSIEYMNSYVTGTSSPSEYIVRVSSQLADTRLALTGSVRFGMFF